MIQVQLVAAGIDSLWVNVKDKAGEGLPVDLADELDELRRQAQDIEDDLPTRFTFAGETLFIKPHGSQRQWRWILHSPSLHLDVGRGLRNHVMGKARLSSAFLWERGIADALSLLYGFLAGFYGGEGFTLQVSEVHLCADLAGWELSLDDLPRFISRSHVKRKAHVLQVAEAAEEDDAPDATADQAPAVEVNYDGRHVTGFEFSKGGAHSCCLYDKTRELQKSRKDWLKVIWEQNGWDGESRVTRVEFRYKRECLRELGEPGEPEGRTGVECPYEMLDQLAGMWAYSTQRWLRHVLPSDDTNKGRWPASAAWQIVQAADCFGEGEPLVRERKLKGHLTIICQMIAGCASTAAAYLASTIPAWDDGANFLGWFQEWMDAYMQEKGDTFAAIRERKRVRLGVVPAPSLAA